ncbi:hypothetical protein [Bacillus methanolicus]|nr:hypothetical protein [Bacillus methanolicus]
MLIKTSLGTFMKIAITAVTISAFIFGGMYLLLSDISDVIADYISKSG